MTTEREATTRHPMQPTPVTDQTVHAWTWRRLLRWAAITDLVVMAVVGLIFRDKEALVFAGIIGVAILLLRFRSGIAGAIVLAVVLLDAAVFMLPAFASNAAHKESLASILIPASLGVISIAGAVAAFASMRRSSSGGRLAGLVVQIALATFVLAVIAALVQQRGEATAAPQAGDVRVDINNVAYAPERLTTAAGWVTFAIHNEDLFWHTFTIDALHLNVDTPIGARRRITVVAIAGTYQFYCRVPGHKAAGMKGTLTVSPISGFVD
jgi:uncharacterized cupredoxin-like copper-binding protein